MRESSKTMYKIGRIFSFVLLGLAALLAVLHLILMLVYLADETKGNWSSELGSMIGTIIWIGFIIVVICLATNAIKLTETEKENKTPHITMIVFGALSGDVFYLLGGIFGLVAIAQEAEENQPKAEAEPEPAENPAPEKEENK